MALDENPVELQNGESYAHNCRVSAIVWTGTTTAGDTCTVSKIGGGGTVWRAQTEVENTYLGLAPTGYAIPCPTGLSVVCPDNNYVLIYLRED
jgi:hypothetical protein